MISDHSPMIGARAGDGWRPWSRRGSKPRPWITYQRRAAKINERERVAADIAAERIAEHAITSAEPRPPIYADAAIAWGTEIDDDFDDWDIDPFPHDWDHDTIDDPGTPITDQDVPGGWGTGLDWGDLQTLTITNRPYLWSTGKES